MREDQQVYLFLVIGALCMLLATLFAGNVDWALGTTPESFYGTLFLSFVMILIAGIFWLSAARLLRPPARAKAEGSRVEKVRQEYVRSGYRADDYRHRSYRHREEE